MNHKLFEGATVWVKHPVEAWIPATVDNIVDGCEIQVSFHDGSTKTMKITTESPIPRHVSSDGDGKTISEEEHCANIIDDLTKIPQIITPAVLHHLRVAYMREQYYCKLGSGTLLALNPFKEVPNLVSTQRVSLYSSSTLKELEDLPAHVYTIAQNAFAAVHSRTGRINQSIIVSGESGAGKTRTVGCLMRFLAEVEETQNVSIQKATCQKNPTPGKISKMTTGSESDSKDLPDTLDIDVEEYVSVKGHVTVDNIEKRVLSSNPVLEAFGNAQTTRNNNSSRFGKYIQLQYSRSGLLVGAKLKTYLLEKTRVVHHDHGERCYHIFYQMLYGSSQKQQEDWKLLRDPFSEGTENEMYTEHKVNFATTVKAMKKLGISDNMQDRIFKVLSAILHLRQLNFDGPDDLQTPCDIIYNDNPDLSKCLMIASELLGLDEQTIKKVITLRRISSHGNRKKSIFLRPSTIRECQIRRDCLLKFIYQILFEWIVRGVQERIQSVNSDNCSFLGLLDIYGFESFENNSLEQLCINFANEKLHHHFCTTFIKNLQGELYSEGVQDACCDLDKSEGCLLALEAPRVSLFSLLNEECKLNRANAECNLKSRIESVFSESEHIKLPRISSVGSSFTISHFAGLVSYNTEFLIEKNKDEVPVEFIETLAMSKNGFVRQLVSYCQNMMNESDNSSSAGDTHEHPRHAKPMPTVLMRFKKSLDELLGILSTTDCHYIRCIKPNKESQPEVFDAQFILSQMEACGIVDTIRVCSSVYSCRMSYEQFHARYYFLVHDAKWAQRFPLDGKDKSQDALLRQRSAMIMKMVCDSGDGITEQMIQFGKTKVFLSTDLFQQLEFLRSSEISKRCSIIQRSWRRYSHKKRCKEMRKLMIAERSAAAVVLQKAWRNKVHVNMCRLQRKYIITTMKKSVAVIECAWIAYCTNKSARIYRKKIRLEKCAIKIQATFRGWLVRRQYKKLLAALHAQSVSLQGLECHDSNDKNPNSLTESCDSNAKVSIQAYQSLDLIHSESQPHVPYFELVSYSSSDHSPEPVHPEIRASKRVLYHRKFTNILSSPDGNGQGNARRILLLDHQDVPSTTDNSSLHSKTQQVVSLAVECNMVNSSHSCTKSKVKPNKDQCSYRSNNLYMGRHTLRTRDAEKYENLSENFDITLKWLFYEMIVVSAWHRLPTVRIMSNSKSFVSPFTRTIFKRDMWASFEWCCNNSLIGNSPFAIHGFITNQSILKYADVRPKE